MKSDRKRPQSHHVRFSVVFWFFHFCGSRGGGPFRPFVQSLARPWPPHSVFTSHTHTQRPRIAQCWPAGVLPAVVPLSHPLFPSAAATYATSFLSRSWFLLLAFSLTSSSSSIYGSAPTRVPVRFRLFWLLLQTEPQKATRLGKATKQHGGKERPDDAPFPRRILPAVFPSPRPSTDPDTVPPLWAPQTP